MIVPGVTFAWTPEQVAALARVLIDAEARRRRDGLGVPPAAVAPFREVVEVAAAVAVARTGQKLARDDADRAPSRQQVNGLDLLLPSRFAARRLGISSRTVRRRAAEAGVGRIVAGRLLFTEQDVEVLREPRLRGKGGRDGEGQAQGARRGPRAA